jgi:5'-nucleotidase
MTDRRPLILLTNDDGIHAEGLRYLRDAVSELGRVLIVAPESEQSAIGHAITLYEPIRVRKVSKNGDLYGYGIKGTPADAVKLAVYSLLDRPPDLVISGINDGPNLGINVLYSGTVSAATEAAILGVPAMAVSLGRKKDPPYESAVPYVRVLARKVLENGLPRGIALNVNVPVPQGKEIRGIKLTRQGLNKLGESYADREDPRGHHYYWLSGEVTPERTDEGTDLHALNEGYVSVTPLFYDLTAHNQVRELTGMVEEL